MFNWLLKLIPEQYKVSILIKKASYTVGKLAVAGLMYGKVGQFLGAHLSPDHLAQIQLAAATVTAAGLEGAHDWAKLKWSETRWL